MKHKALIKSFFILTITLIVSNIASAKDKEHPYIRNGISFSIPGDWSIIANDSIGNNAYYFSAERNGKNSTGLFTVTWINRVESTQKTIALHQQSMKSANIYRKPGIEFSVVKPDLFARLKGESCRYVTFVKEQKLEGVIYCFNSANKTIIVFFQSGINDLNINNKAFELLKQTFNCRE